MRRLLNLLCALVLAATGLAVQASPFATARLPLRHIGIVQGLAQSSAQVIVQDRRGYMWIGTQSGLQRYDGYGFVNYSHDPANPASLAQNDIAAMAPAADGTLWVATRSAGLDMLRQGTGGFEHFTHKPGQGGSLSSDTVYSVLVDRAGQVWVGTQAGLDRLQSDGTFRHYPPPQPDRSGFHVLRVFQDRDGRIWAGTTHGVFTIKPGGDHLQALATSGTLVDAASAQLNGVISSFAEMPDGTLWLGGDNGIVVLTAGAQVVRVYRHADDNPFTLASDHVRAIVRGRSGAIWVATYGGGLNRIRPDEQTFTRFHHDPGDPASLSGDNLYTLFVDQTGLLWIGSLGGGIDIYNPTSRAFESIRHAQDNESDAVDDLVWTVGADIKQRIWAGTHGGLLRVDTHDGKLVDVLTAGQVTELGKGNPVMVLSGDASGGLWIANTTQLFHRAAGSDAYTPIDLGLPEGSSDAADIRQVFTDHSQRIWVGTAWGLLQLDAHSGKVLRRFSAAPDRADGLPRPSISSICQSSDGALWIGTGHGLRRFDGVHDRFTAPTVRSGRRDVLGVSDILSCLAAADGSLWIGTASGIIHFQPGKGITRSYGESDGLPSLTIYALLRDAGSNIWASTDRGLARLNAATGHIRSFGQRDGLDNEEFIQNSAYASTDGTLYFGGVHGITVVHPDRLTRSRSQPQIALSSYTLIGRDGEQMSTHVPSGGLTLNHRQNIVTFSAAVMDYTDPSANFFRYRLLGFDDSWHTLRGRRNITFTNLDPGNYTLEVTGASSNDVLSTHVARLPIHVLAPPWRSWWAWLAYAIATTIIIGTFLYVFALWIRRQRDLISEQQRRRWAEAQHQLIQEVTRLDDERDIVEHLLQRLPQLIEHDRVVFYAEFANVLGIMAKSGFTESELPALRQWPNEHADFIERLRNQGPSDPLLALDAHPFRSVTPDIKHFIELPIVTDEGDLRLLVIGRAQPPFNAAEHDIADVLLRQINVVMDRARLLRKLAILASTDGLTQVLNRRSFLEHAQTDFKRARRYQEPFALLMLDLDHFKTVNDTHGHQIGDEVLRELVNICRNRLRESDSIGRYGGEEFVICLPHADADTARTVAERLRMDVQDAYPSSVEGAIRVTVSIGVAVATLNDTGLDSMIARADTALYAAKRGGRNRVIVHAEENLE